MKTCVTCQHSVEDECEYYCRKEINTGEMSPVTGEPIIRRLAGGVRCSWQRSSGGECTAVGIYWQEKEAQPSLRALLGNYARDMLKKNLKILLGRRQSAATRRKNGDNEVSVLSAFILRRTVAKLNSGPVSDDCCICLI